MRLLRVILFIVATVIAAFALVMVVFFVFLHREEQPYVAFESVASPDKRYILTTNLANPRSPYGPHSIEVVLNHSADGIVITRKEFSLANDGANIYKENITIQWSDNDHGSVCLKGAEQNPSLIRINVTDQSIDATGEGC